MNVTVNVHIEADTPTVAAIHQAIPDTDMVGPYATVKIGALLSDVTLFFASPEALHAWALEIVKATETTSAACGEPQSEASETPAFGSAVGEEPGGHQTAPEAVSVAAAETSAVPCGNHPCVRSSGHVGDCLAAPDDDGDEWTAGGNQRFGL